MLNPKNISYPSKKYSMLSRFSNFFGIVFLILFFAHATASCTPKKNRAFPLEKGHISVLVEGLHNDTGRVLISLFASGSGFPDHMDQAFQNLSLPILNRQSQGRFADVPFGQYALSVLHDENADGQMKKGWYGQPLEGFGFYGSNDSMFGPPSFEEASFYLLSKTRELRVRVRYDTIQTKKQTEPRSQN